MRREWINHLRQVVTPHDVLELPSEVSNLKFESGADKVTNPLSGQQPPADDSEVIAEGGGGDDEGAVEKTFVKVVLWYPSRLKLVKSFSAEGQALSDSDICVSIRKQILGDAEGGSGLISCKNTGATLTQGRFVLSGLCNLQTHRREISKFLYCDYLNRRNRPSPLP